LKRTESNFFQQLFIAMFPTYFDYCTDITLNTITGGIIMPGNVWIKIFTDEKEVIIVRQTEPCTINQICISTISSADSKRADKIFYFWFMHNTFIFFLNIFGCKLLKRNYAEIKKIKKLPVYII